ncbi:MAG: InlB B-repeat-containing protein, partial [Paludibacteraceae bacterium]|nr:InlB B-repeat-containing protein [Paludibacteraceae bacterium]
MNTTLTTYAEKKAKQFLNLLQGYTKGIRITAILILLLMGVSNAWAWTTYYLKSDNTTWDTGNNGWEFTHNTTTTTYMANGSKFKLWRTDWGGDGWFGVNNSTLKPGDGGLQFKQYENNVQYNGPSGMVCFHMDQSSNRENSPWVWITRPTFYLKHNWSGDSWTWKALTDNQDGTYQLTDYYGGTGVNYGDNNSSQDGWGYVTATTTGTLANGNKCIFTFNSADKTINITRLYTIKYDGNGSTTGVPSEHDKKHGTNTALSSSTPTRTGYTFAEWNTKADGSGTNYAKGATYSANADVTLYAKWTAHTYTVAFNANGGTGTMSNQNFTYGTAKNLTANTFTRTGYTFAGWNTKADGTGTSYTDKQSVNNLTPTNGATVTLYAKWTANTYTVAFNANGGTGTMSNQNFTYGTTKNLTANT